MSMPSMTSSAAMTNAARQRQFLYAGLIVLIFGAMWPYNEWVSRIKRDNDLGEATIGQIDTGGFMLKLGMIGGFRGVVANYLWSQVRTYERTHEWDKMKNTVEFITRLQPHFLSIWTYQGWNLAYNVSVEWDAPEDKYVWIKKGINFLKDGVAKNQKMRGSDLIWDTAWTYYHKIGFADEAIVLRRLFRDDPDIENTNFKLNPTTGEIQHDNFQVAGGWFTRAVQKVDLEGGQLDPDRIRTRLEYVDKQRQHKGTSGDLAFRTMPAHAQTRYAGALEKQSIRDIEPRFGEVAKGEWLKAKEAWLTFGLYEWPAFRFENQKVRIDDCFLPESSARFKSLTPEQKYWTNRWAEQTHYKYWKDKADTESEDNAWRTRQMFYEGLKALKSANFPEAVKSYKSGLDLWADVLKRHPIFGTDTLTRSETAHTARRYLFALKQTGEKEPENYPFKEWVTSATDEYNPDPFDGLEMMKTSAGKTTAPTLRPQ